MKWGVSSMFNKVFWRAYPGKRKIIRYPCISTQWLIFFLFVCTNGRVCLCLWLLVVLLFLPLLLNTAPEWEPFCLVSSKSGNSSSQVINIITCQYQMLAADVMRKGVKAGRELGDDAGYHVFSKNWFLKAVTLGCFFLIWLAKRTLQILHGCFDVRACIAGWNNGNMCALPKFRLWLSPDVKVRVKNSLEVFSMYGSRCSSSQQVHHSN